MSKERKKNQLLVKLKEDKDARAIAITVTVMLLVLTAIIITTVIANRAARKEEILPPPDDGEVIVPEPEQNDVPTQKDGEDTPAPAPVDEDKHETSPVDTGLNNAPADTLPERLILPVSGVLQKSHDPELQVFSSTMGDYRTHLGVDIGTIPGAAVSAMADGVIAQVWEDISMGQCVAVKHGGDAYTIYKNLSTELPEQTTVGRTVKAGDVIGYVGETAMVEVGEEPHLHVEMTVNGLQVDPTAYLDADAIATLHESANFEDVS